MLLNKKILQNKPQRVVDVIV